MTYRNPIAECLVAGKIESQNSTQYAHWRACHKWRRLLSIMGYERNPNVGKRWVRITSYRSRLLDHGNLVGGCKPIPDALKRLGWIEDDTPELVEIEYLQIKEKGRDKAPRTRVEVFDYDYKAIINHDS
jgi:hypothetical protein